MRKQRRLGTSRLLAQRRAVARLACIGWLSPTFALAATPAPRLNVELGYDPRVFGSAAQLSLGPSLTLPLAQGALEASAGLRLVSRATPLPEAQTFGRLALCARQGVFSPAIGVQLEVAPIPLRRRAVDATPGSLEARWSRDERRAHLWLALWIAPLRVIAPRGSLALALRLATPANAELGARVEPGVMAQLGYPL